MSFKNLDGTSISTALYLDMDGILLVEFRNLLFKLTENKETAFFGPLRLLRVVAGKATEDIALQLVSTLVHSNAGLLLILAYPGGIALCSPALGGGSRPSI